MGKEVGVKVAPRIAGRESEGFEHCFIEFFRSIADAFWAPNEQQAFVEGMGAHFGIDAAATPLNKIDRLWELLHAHLRSPIPRCITMSARMERGMGDPLDPLTKLTNFFAEGFRPATAFSTLGPLDKAVIDAHMRQFEAQQAQLTAASAGKARL